MPIKIKKKFYISPSLCQVSRVDCRSNQHDTVHRSEWIVGHYW